VGLVPLGADAFEDTSKLIFSDKKQRNRFYSQHYWESKLDFIIFSS
jgi:hypothetical protein